jgi:hypothetical protein
MFILKGVLSILLGFIMLAGSFVLTALIAGMVKWLLDSAERRWPNLGGNTHKWLVVFGNGAKRVGKWLLCALVVLVVLAELWGLGQIVLAR